VGRFHSLWVGERGFRVLEMEMVCALHGEVDDA